MDFVTIATDAGFKGDLAALFVVVFVLVRWVLYPLVSLRPRVESGRARPYITDAAHRPIVALLVVALAALAVAFGIVTEPLFQVLSAALSAFAAEAVGNKMVSKK